MSESLETTTVNEANESFVEEAKKQLKNFDKDGLSLLHKSISENQLEKAQFYLFLGADPNVENIVDEEKTKYQAGLTPLHFAKTKKAVELLVSAGADVNKGINKASSPLYFAASNNIPEVVSALLRFGGVSRESIKDDDKRPWANFENDVRKITKALKDPKNTGLNTINADRKPSITFLLAKNGDKENLAKIFDMAVSQKQLQEAKNEALYGAILTNNNDLAKFVLDNGANPNSPLIYDSLRLLYNKDSEITYVPQMEQTLVQYCVSKHTSEKVLAKNPSNKTKAESYLKSIQLLMENGADANQPNFSSNDNAIETAIRQRNADALKLLLNDLKKVSLAPEGSFSNLSPLQMLFLTIDMEQTSGDIDNLKSAKKIARILLEKDPDINSKIGSSNKTVFQITKENYKQSMNKKYSPEISQVHKEIYELVRSYNLVRERTLSTATSCCGGLFNRNRPKSVQTREPSM